MAEERVVARMARQAILTERKPPVGLSFVVYEAALRNPQVDVDQLRHLLDRSRLRNVVLQVLPFERAIPVALMGPMVLLETRDHERFAFAEGPLTSELSADPRVVSLATERLSTIRAQALSPAESARFIEGMVDRQVHVRDSKAAPSGPEVRIAAPAWAAFVAGVRPGA